MPEVLVSTQNHKKEKQILLKEKIRGVELFYIVVNHFIIQLSQSPAGFLAASAFCLLVCQGCEEGWLHKEKGIPAPRQALVCQELA